MKISKTIKHHINMGNYEWLEISATAEDEYRSEPERDDALDRIDRVINQTLEPDLQKAYDATDEEGSYVNELIKRSE